LNLEFGTSRLEEYLDRSYGNDSDATIEFAAGKTDSLIIRVYLRFCVLNPSLVVTAFIVIIEARTVLCKTHVTSTSGTKSA